MLFLKKLEKTILKFTYNRRRYRRARVIRGNKSKTSGTTISDLKLFCKKTVTKTAWYWPQNKHMDQLEQKLKRGRNIRHI